MTKIDIYTSAGCPDCKRAKALLRAKNLSFNEFEVDGNPELIAESVKRSDGMRTVPQIFIEDLHIGGYDNLANLEKTGQLDALLKMQK